MKWLLLFGWIALFLGGVTHYSGSWLTYTIFSLVFLAMLINGFYRQASYGYLFLSAMLWLGFWLKLTVHTILNYPFVEAVGNFGGGAHELDEVLHVATFASLGVISANLIYRSMKLSMRTEIQPVAPSWYINNRKFFWICLIVVAVGLYWANAKYGVHLIGLAPRTILVWPFNALIAWSLNIGLATVVGVLLWWDIALKKSITITIYAALVEALFSSVSMLSRAVFVFHAIPQLLSIYRLRRIQKGWTSFKVVLIAVLFVLALMISIAATTTFRNLLYQSDTYSSTAFSELTAKNEIITAQINIISSVLENATPAEKLKLQEELRKILLKRKKIEDDLAYQQAKMAMAMNSSSPQTVLLINEFGYQIKNGALKVILQLSVDRWIGLEGLMAVQAYPQKNIELFTRALTEKSEVGKTDIYQMISNSIYLKADSTKFKFATLPGAAAFLYLSNSGLIVILGMTALSLIVLFAEFFIMKFTANPIVCSLYGAIIASNVAQLGGSPRESVPFYLMLVGGILVILVIQSNFCSRAFGKPELTKETKK